MGPDDISREVSSAWPEPAAVVWNWAAGPGASTRDGICRQSGARCVPNRCQSIQNRFYCVLYF